MVEICLIWGFGFPFLGTVLGAGLVWLLNWNSGSLRRIVSGGAAGVMGTACFYSLLLPGLKMSVTALVGVGLGIGFLTLTAFLTRKKGGLGVLVALAVVLHNIPEGMATGVSFGSWMAGSGISAGQAVSVGLGIGLQNLPDGAMVALPLWQRGMSRSRAFLAGVLSALVEPVAAGLMLFHAEGLIGLLPVLMGFAAGAMGYVIITELIPAMELQKGEQEGFMAMILGIIFMGTVL